MSGESPFLLRHWEVTVENTEKVERIRTICAEHLGCINCPLIDQCKRQNKIDGIGHYDFCIGLWDYAIQNGIIKESDQEAKADNGKPQYTLVPPALLDACERVRAYGNKKYHSPDNWRNVEAQRYWEALIRHVRAAWDDYRKRDKESGLRHLDHIICNAGFIEQFLEEEENGE